jgi:hypothetical protein
MFNIFENLLGMSGGDGDFVKGGTPPEVDPAEIGQILEAWSQERGRSIECALLMRRIRRALSRILASGRLKGQTEREMKNLLRLIDSIGPDAPAIET